MIMSIDKSLLFLEWLDAEEKIRGYTDYEIAKRGSFSHSALSRVRTEGIPPGWAICVKIADVLKVSPITVFRKAGLLPVDGGENASLEDWSYLINQLPPDEQEEVREIVELKIERRQKQEALKALKPKKAG